MEVWQRWILVAVCPWLSRLNNVDAVFYTFPQRYNLYIYIWVGGELHSQLFVHGTCDVMSMSAMSMFMRQCIQTCSARIQLDQNQTIRPKDPSTYSSFYCMCILACYGFIQMYCLHCRKNVVNSLTTQLRSYEMWRAATMSRWHVLCLPLWPRRTGENLTLGCKSKSQIFIEGFYAHIVMHIV